MTQYAEWKGYWRNPDTLWVYDMTPEVGVNTSFMENEWTRVIREAGMRLVRVTMEWRTEQANPGGFRWAVNQALKDHNDPTKPSDQPIEVVVVVHTPPEEFQNTNPEETQDPAAYRAKFNNALADFMAQVATEYPEVKFWQIWNEPDAGCENGKFFNGWDVGSDYHNPNRYEQGKNYAAMLKVVYPRIKAANPKAWVLTAGFTGEEGLPDHPQAEGCHARDINTWEFVRGIYANGGTDYFDILAAHTYGATAGGHHSILDTGNIITYKLNTEWSDPNRPVWVTEFGAGAWTTWNQYEGDILDPNRDKSKDRDLFDNYQRQWWEEALGVQQSSGLYQKIIGYRLWTDVGGYHPNTTIPPEDQPDYGFTLFRRDKVTKVRNANDPRPAYTLLKSHYATNILAEQRGTRIGEFRIAAPDRVPIGYSYYHEGDTLVIQNVAVNTLVPTEIRFEPVAQPQRVAIHRLYNASLGDHMYSPDPNEGSSVGYAPDHLNYFYLEPAAGPALAPLYRCFIASNGHHFVTVDGNCEAANVPAEGILGYIATSQLAGTVPLYRALNPWSGNRVSTTEQSEYLSLTRDQGWVDEGITGYVWK